MMSIYKLLFLQNYRLGNLGDGRNRIVGTSRVVLRGKDISFVLVLESWRTRNAKIICLWYGLNLISDFVFRQTNWLDFFFQGLNIKLPTFVGIFRWKTWVFIVQWSSDGPELSENGVNFDMPSYSNSYFFSSTSFVFPSRCQWISLYLRVTPRF